MAFNLLAKRDIKNNFISIRHFYILLMFVFLLIRNIGIYTFLPGKVDSAVSALIGMVGIALIVYGVITHNIVIDFKKHTLLILFMVFFGISCLVNYRYGILHNVADFIWMTVRLFILYVSGINETKEDRYKLIYKIQNIIIYMWLLLSFISILTLVFQLQCRYNVSESYWIPIGLYENRLYGAFLNTNSASILSFISLVFSIFQISVPCKFNISKKINVANVVIQFLYISLSEARGTYMVLLASVVVTGSVVFFYISQRQGNTRNCNKYVRVILSILIGFICCALVLGAMLLTNKVFSYIHIFEKPLIVSNQIQFHENTMVVERNDFINNNDVSNSRFKIWISAWEIFKTKWLFGIPKGNVLAYAKEAMPWTFMAQRNYDRTHNFWIGVPLYTGVCGALCFFSFFIKQAFGFLKHYIRVGIKKSSPMLNLSILIFFSICVYALVELEILFVNTACSLIFWVFLEFANYCLKKCKC